jgi:putative tricarboxylic transport membrane protein
MKNLKRIVSVLFSAILLFSATTTSSVAIDKLHFVIGGGAGGGWDGTARGTGEALTKAGMLKSASFENMSGGGGGKALAFMINNKPANTVSGSINTISFKINYKTQRLREWKWYFIL